MNDLELAEVPLNFARMTVRDLIQQAYDAGKTSNEERLRIPHAGKPTAEETNKAIAAVERGAVGLAHARMEFVAQACGFEGLTEALGYLQTLRANPIAALLREAVNLSAIGDIHPSDDPAADGGWGNWMKRAQAIVGNAAPPEQEVLSGCAVRAEIQRRPWLEESAGRPMTLGSTPESVAPYEADVAEHDERMAKLYGNLGDGPNLDNLSTQQEMCVAEIAAVVADTWDFYGLPRTNTIGDLPVYYWGGRNGRPGSRHAQTQLGAPYTAEHVMIDETRGPPLGKETLVFTCRIIESVEPLALGHTIFISREELQAVGSDWKPTTGGATTSKH